MLNIRTHGHHTRTNTTRTIFAALSAATLISSLAACSSATDHEGGKPRVLTTFTILEDITRTIGGDAVEVSSITEPGAEIHGYDPTPSNIAEASKADLVLENGLGLEHWTDKLLENSKAKRVTVSDGVEPINIEGTDSPNPHAWMSPRLVKIYVDNIVRALSDIDPNHSTTFENNAKEYKNKLDGVDNKLTEGLEKLPKTKRALVTCEGAFSYLAKEAGMEEGYIWPVNTKGEITPGQIRQAADFVKEHHVPAVFCESTVEHGPQEQLMRETGAADGGTLYVDSLSPEDGPVPTYLDLINHDVTTIVEGLNK
ncbi:metal ABC transporter substrate-binding protein [Corynebacterium anserum]|uniref:Zinc ABC transporter solute-binding protein n=1 Tax=Corynebacterium anserum TaxID=2684406 RepID=A0A7G7YPF5_9CORY|nr:metal ABC transporter substrate-binding protein [Corynebacterium anserum]MBC2681997.1 zinc ABC transporter solute-binding protein [Corynebacterium anserum]QNH96375.1 zinc ABC transporter solute-binding protein [Corynebacterium anserum]